MSKSQYGPLFGVDQVDAEVKVLFGQTIGAVELINADRLVLTFRDGRSLMLSDEQQSCCEYRYIRTDDTLFEFVGAKLLGIEVKEAPDLESAGHEVAFLEVRTSLGALTLATHNEHTGEYGGFQLRARVFDAPVLEVKKPIIKKPVLEAKIKKQVRDALDLLDAWYFMPVATGRGHRGIPDFIVCLDGRFIGIETKATAKHEPTLLQQKSLRGIARAGGTAMVVHEGNIHQLLEVLQNAERNEDWK